MKVKLQPLIRRAKFRRDFWHGVGNSSHSFGTQCFSHFSRWFMID